MPSTTNYSIFKKHPSNRDIDPANLRRVTNSIKAKNLLHLKPLIVNENLEIIDGQHRLEAAKILNIPIHYEVSYDSNAPEDIIILNLAQKSWTIKDYLKYYCGQGKEDYIKIDNFCKKYTLEITICLILLYNNHGGNFAVFRRGSIKFPNDVIEAQEKMLALKTFRDFLEQKLIGPKRFIYNIVFTKTFFTFISKRNVSFNILMNKLLLNVQLIRPCASFSDYYNIFKAIYNYKNQYPVD